MTLREKLVELFYENNVFCDQKIEGLADDVMDIVANGVTVQDNAEISDELLQQLRNAAITILHEEPTIEVVQEWVSVKDRLPTIFDADADNCVLAIHKASNKRYYHWRSVADNPFDFTHWMKTPQPPEEGAP